MTPPMPTLCGVAGPLPELYRPHLNSNGDLQAGDALGLEAQWVLEQVDTSQTSSNYIPESVWSRSQIEEDEWGVGCCICGDETADTTRGICRPCDLHEYNKELCKYDEELFEAYLTYLAVSH